MQLTIAEGLRALRERWWILVVAALVAATTAFVVTRLPWVEPRWKSSVWVQATGRFDYGNTLALERQLRPLAEQVRQLSIMRAVDRNLHLDLPAERLLAETRAEPVQDSDQIRVDVEDPDPRRAESIALEIADVYTKQHNADQTAKLREEQVILTVLDRPSAATLSWPQTRVIVPAAGLLGLLAAAAVVITLATFDDTLKTPDDVARELGLPLIGLVPAGEGRRQPRLARLARRPGAAPPGLPARPPTMAAARPSVPAGPGAAAESGAVAPALPGADAGAAGR